MEINIRGDKLKVTEAIKNYVTEKLSRLDKYFDSNSEIRCNIVVKVRDKDQIIEVTIPTDKFTLRAEEKHNDLYAAIDLVVDKLERQIRKNKTKLNRYKTFEPIFAQIEETQEESNQSKIIKRKILDVKPMDEEEAILQMELLDHDFFVFSNIDEECISVLYKRKDGAYGIINTNK